MDFRRTILKEIKNMLNEQANQEHGSSMKKAYQEVNRIYAYLKNASPEAIPPAAAKSYLKNLAFFIENSNDAPSGTNYQSVHMQWNGGKGLNDKKDAICRLGSPNGEYNSVKIDDGTYDGETYKICEGFGGKSKPPTPPTPDPGPKPETELKGHCKQGSSFIGKNAVTDGPQISELQLALMTINLPGFTNTKLGYSFTGVDKPDLKGTYGLATEAAVMSFQGINGPKYAAKIKSELGSNLPFDKKDGCVGPKTACAILLAGSGRPLLGYDKDKCIKAFGKKKIEKGKLSKADDADPDKAIVESLNWNQKIKEQSSNSIFKRLVESINK